MVIQKKAGNKSHGYKKNRLVVIKKQITTNLHYFWWTRRLLVLLAEEVVDRLDRIELAKRHFHEDGVPVTHGSVPQAW